MPHPVLNYKSKKEAVLTDRLQGHKKDRRSLTPVSFTFIYPSFQVLFQSVVVDVIPLDVVEILLKNSHKFLFHNVTPLSVRRDFFRSLRTSSVIHQTPPPVPPNGNKKWSNLANRFGSLGLPFGAAGCINFLIPLFFRKEKCHESLKPHAPHGPLRTDHDAGIL